MWGQADLKQTRAYHEAEQEGRRTERQELLQITVPSLLDKGMTIEEIAQHFKLPIETIQQ
jgi:predicted transposase YdaD